MGAGERRGGRHGGRRGGRVMIKITNKNNPEMAARMAGFTYCGVMVGIMMLFPGLAMTAVGVALGTFHLYPGAALLAIAAIFIVTSLLLCLFVVKPSCCYPKDPVVGTAINGRLVTSVDPATGLAQQPSSIVVVGSQPAANNQYATNYGNAYGQPVGNTVQPPQYGAPPPQYGAPPPGPPPGAPPPSYTQANMYSAPDPVYPPPPPAAY